jgi:hypothetical protein
MVHKEVDGVFAVRDDARTARFRFAGRCDYPGPYAGPPGVGLALGGGCNCQHTYLASSAGGEAF